jgi:hypothetical protein
MNVEDIRDIRPPVGMPWYVWLLIIVAACLAAFAVYLFYKRRFPGSKLFAPVKQHLPWEVAYERLDNLSSQRYAEQGLFKLFYSTLSDIVRHYLEDQFTIKAPEMTTEEFLNFVKNSPALKAEHKQILKDFLNGCDMVKFAKYMPTINEAQVNLDLARKLITETKDEL